MRGILAESPQCNGVRVFPAGTPIEGRIGRVQKVGMGFIHESSSIQIDFDRILPATGSPLAIAAHIVEVDNGRETVRNGVLHRLRSTDNLQDRITTRLMHLPTWNPSSLWIVLAYRATFPISPEPEIYFPPGTDLRVELSAPLTLADGLMPVAADQDFDEPVKEALDQDVLDVPERSATPTGDPADIVNLVFLGNRAEVDSAFQAAGWTGSDTISTRTAFRILGAFVALKNYAHLPISRQSLAGQPSDSMWQKSFDSIEKRDHLRIWSEPRDWQGQPAWASASIRETGAVFSFRRFKVIHHTDVDLDSEREKVVRDLTLAGCVAAVHNAPRAEMPLYSQNATGDQMRTDGAVAVVQLKQCQPPDFETADASPELPAHPRSRLTRYVRAQVLSVRNLWRANAVYGAYDLTRLAVDGIRSKRARDREEALARKSNRAPHAAAGPVAIPGLASIRLAQ